MGACYDLINFTRRERLPLVSLAGCKSREITSHHPAAALATWYMLRCRGDEIAFVSDDDVQARRTFFGRTVSHDLIESFTDVLDETIAHAVAARVLIDDGWRQFPENDPDQHLHTRTLRIDDDDGPLPNENL